MNNFEKGEVEEGELMEDSLAPFADLLEGDIDEVQGPGRLQEFTDYGRLYEYNNAFADFSIWDGVFETKQKTPTSLQHLQSSFTKTQVADATDLLTGDFAEASTSSHGNASNSQPQNGFQASGPTDIGPPDAELQSEMLELLSIFEVVYENKSAVDTPSMLKKCIFMCERIMDRYYKLPQVVAMHEQAKTLLQMFEDGKTGNHSTTSSNFTNENGTSTGRSFRDNLKADIKEALDRVDRDAEESDTYLKDPDAGKEVNGVYVLKGIWYCKTHVEREQCKQCGVDYLLRNQVHREMSEEANIDDTLRKEQQRLEELERQSPDPGIKEAPIQARSDQDDENFQIIAKELNEELARAREKEEADFLSLFTSFQISDESKSIL